MTATFTAPLAALTTIFTPPCPTSWLLIETKAPSQFPSVCVKQFPTGPASCDPPSWEDYITSRGFEYYSPAICPSGFSVGPSCIVTSANTAQGFPAIQDGETAAYCVPTGHTCTTDTSDFRGGVWGALQTTTAKGVSMTVGPAIQIRWRDSDLSTLETDPLTPGLAPSQTEIPTTIPVTRSSSSLSITTSLIVSVRTSSRPTKSITSTTSLAISRVATSTSTKPASTSSAPSPGITAPTQNTTSNSDDSSVSASDSKSHSPQTSNFTVAAIALTTILITILLLYTAHSTLRQYRRYRSGSKENAPFFTFLFTTPSRASRLSRSLFAADSISLSHSLKSIPTLSDLALEATSPMSELGAGDPLGSKDNPAELATTDSKSFMSRVSRMFTVRSRRSSTSTATIEGCIDDRGMD
ncbi:hypothetical protein F5Y18DRAFT_420160 [Xylariaceae sp. FL1019]|nr:hypothetical protein F5Y18DRAFT_420160 [Xylariaceae sp. FL1019]